MLFERDCCLRHPLLADFRWQRPRCRIVRTLLRSCCAFGLFCFVFYLLLGCDGDCVSVGGLPRETQSLFAGLRRRSAEALDSPPSRDANCRLGGSTAFLQNPSTAKTPSCWQQSKTLAFQKRSWKGTRFTRGEGVDDRRDAKCEEGSLGLRSRVAETRSRLRRHRGLDAVSGNGGEDACLSEDANSVGLAEDAGAGGEGEKSTEASSPPVRRRFSRPSPFVSEQLKQQRSNAETERDFLYPPSQGGASSSSSVDVSFGVGMESSRRPADDPGSRANRSSFVSFHSQLFSASDLKTYLHRKGLPCSEQLDKFVCVYCPFCPPHKNRRDNLNKLIFFKNSGNYYCHRCGSKGSLFDFKVRHGDINVQHVQTSLAHNPQNPTDSLSSDTNFASEARRRLHLQWKSFVQNLEDAASAAESLASNDATQQMDRTCHQRVFRYLTEERGLRLDTVRRCSRGSPSDELRPISF